MVTNRGRRGCLPCCLVHAVENEGTGTQPRRGPRRPPRAVAATANSNSRAGTEHSLSLSARPRRQRISHSATPTPRSLRPIRCASRRAARPLGCWLPPPFSRVQSPPLGVAVARVLDPSGQRWRQCVTLHYSLLLSPLPPPPPNAIRRAPPPPPPIPHAPGPPRLASLTRGDHRCWWTDGLVRDGLPLSASPPPPSFSFSSPSPTFLPPRARSFPSPTPSRISQLGSSSDFSLSLLFRGLQSSLFLTTLLLLASVSPPTCRLLLLAAAAEFFFGQSVRPVPVWERFRRKHASTVEGGEWRSFPFLI